MREIHLGSVAWELHDGWSATRFADGTALHAIHLPQAGQDITAAWCGYADPRDMNRDHDLMHCLVAHMLGLDFSPTLRGVVDGKPDPTIAACEEEAILALQRFAVMAGVDLVAAAQKFSKGQP